MSGSRPPSKQCLFMPIEKLWRGENCEKRQTARSRMPKETWACENLFILQGVGFTLETLRVNPKPHLLRCKVTVSKSQLVNFDIQAKGYLYHRNCNMGIVPAEFLAALVVPLGNIRFLHGHSRGHRIDSRERYSRAIWTGDHVSYSLTVAHTVVHRPYGVAETPSRGPPGCRGQRDPPSG